MKKISSNKMKYIKGSATLVVIISSIVFSVYATTANTEALNAEYMQKGIKKKIKQIYEKDIDKIQNIYDNITIDK